MKRLRFTAIIFTIATVSGCTEEQLQQTDQFVADVNNVAVGARAVLESPPGQAIPSPIREIAGLVVGLAGAGVATYETWRKKQMEKTTRAIVRGIEKIDKQHRIDNPNPAADIKASIGAYMEASGIKTTGNKIVEKLKIA